MIAQIDPDRLIMLVERFGALAILAILLWMIFARWLPRQDQANRELILRVSDDCHRTTNRQTEVMEKLENAIELHIGREEVLLQGMLDTLRELSETQKFIRNHVVKRFGEEK